MADLSIVAASVAKSTSGNVAQGTAGATITQGQPVYIDTANSNVIKPADNNATAPANTVAGIALTASSSGQPVLYATQDPAFVSGATLTSGDRVYLSATAGGLTKTVSDLTSGMTVILVGIANGDGTLNLRPLAGGAIP